MNCDVGEATEGLENYPNYYIRLSINFIFYFLFLPFIIFYFVNFHDICERIFYNLCSLSC